MSINWFVVIAQVVNFLVLVFLLKRFLYGPIIKAMDEREASIAARQQEARDKGRAAEKEAAAYREKRRLLQEQEEEFLAGARAAGEEERRALAGKARRELEETRRRWQDNFLKERETFIAALRRQIAAQSCRVARRALEDLAGTGLEDAVLQVFARKVAEMDPAGRDRLAAALSATAAGGGRVVVESAFPVPEERRRTLEEALRAQAGAAGAAGESLSFIYAEQPALVCGVRVGFPGYEIAWNVDDYLKQVEERVLQSLEAEAVHEAAALGT